MENQTNKSDIPKWYTGQTILITGATGFMGKVLVEKLLRTCLNISTIFVVIRSKKGKSSIDRLVDFFNCPVFDGIKSQSNAKDLLNKIHCINGDVTYKNLNLSEHEFQLLKNNVTIVFHMAANVRFDQPLKSATLLNVGGALNILELACHFSKLKVFIHVSTTYCHCDQIKLEERLYPAPHNPRKILELVKWMDESLLNNLTPKLIGNLPNTYAYTKCLTEQLVSEYKSKFPIAICRPSIVTAAWKEPMPGWVDNLNGPTGLLIGAGKGVIRTMHCNAELIADIVPVDISVNSLILIAWQTGINSSGDSNKNVNAIRVFNVTVNQENSKSWGEAINLGRKLIDDYPFSVALWYPGGSFRSNYLTFAITAFFTHTIPAYLVDSLMYLTNNKPFLVRAQKRISHGLKVLQYYTTRPWYFHNDKISNLHKQLSEKDRNTYYIDNGEVVNDDYIKSYILGARKYCVGENPDTIPHARKVLRRLYYLHVISNIVMVCILLRLLYSFL